MSRVNRRQLFQHSILGLAAAGSGGLVLQAEAAPTEATEDVHNYLDFLDKNGIPQVQPAGTWKGSHVDILGPFYLPGAPLRGKITSPLEPGKPLVMRGRVWAFDKRKPIANALLDVWQADAEGRYDMTSPQNPPEWNEFRNRIRLGVDETGYYEFETIRPGAYGIGNGTRPSHIHYMVQAAGYKKLVTQIYFKGDPFIKNDPWASKSNLIVETVTIKEHGGTYQQGTFDIVLEKA